MPFLGDTSIRYQLRNIVMVTVGLALFMASLAFVSYDILSYRRSIVRELDVMTHLVEASSSAALTFEDADLARAALRPLEGSRDVVAAWLFAESGARLAEYRKEGAAAAPPPSHASWKPASRWCCRNCRCATGPAPCMSCRPRSPLPATRC